MLANSEVWETRSRAMHTLVSSFERRFVAKLDAMLPRARGRLGSELVVP